MNLSEDNMYKLNQEWKPFVEKTLGVTKENAYQYALTLEPLIVPKLISRKGIDAFFNFDTDFFNKYTNQCIKVIALYTLALFGASKDTDIYILNYSRNNYTSFELNKLLIACFFNIPIEGKVFNVSKEKPFSEFEKKYAMSEGITSLKDCYNLRSVGKLTKSETITIDEPTFTKQYSKGIKTVKKASPAFSCKFVEVPVEIIDCYSPGKIKKGVEYFDAHHCFGCGVDVIKKEPIYRKLNNQIFDFDKFFINTTQDKNMYKITFNNDFNEPFKHASYTSAVRGTRNIIGAKGLVNIDYVNDILIEVLPECIKSTYYGISVF